MSNDPRCTISDANFILQKNEQRAAASMALDLAFVQECLSYALATDFPAVSGTAMLQAAFCSNEHTAAHVHIASLPLCISSYQLCKKFCGDIWYHDGMSAAQLMIGTITGTLGLQGYWDHTQKMGKMALDNDQYFAAPVSCVFCAHDGFGISTAIPFKTVAQLAQRYYPMIELAGTGDLILTGEQQSQALTIGWNFNGALKIPKIHNAITNARGAFSYYPEQQAILLEPITLRLCRGIVSTQASKLIFDRVDGSHALHMRCELEGCDCTFSHDAAAIISGGITIKKTQNSPLQVQATLFLDSSHLYQDLFHPPHTWLNSSSSASPVRYDCLICTKEPTEIRLNGLTADASYMVRLSGDAQDAKMPLIEGTLSLQNGVLEFPYKPLYITDAQVHFIPGNHMPCIQLQASNLINGYDITLTASGDMADPLVLLSANPFLTENQIVSLLCTGSIHESLNAIVPALSCFALKEFLLHSLHVPPVVQKKLWTWDAFFSRVYFTPLFNDYSARGGIRGAFELRVTDYLRVLMQRNFTLTEDTRFSLEYDLTDAITLRAVRDERRDINAQIQMRLKF